jgi:hypothetical protein
MTMRVKNRVLLTLLLVAGSMLLATRAAAQTYKLEKAAAPPPAALSAAVRDTLSAEVLRVMGPRGLLCEVWLRKTLPTAAAPTDEPDGKMVRLAEGTLVGAMRLPGDTRDFRQQIIHAGVYTLRYIWQPVTADHLGLAEQRDFLLVAPAAIDTNPAGVTHDETVNLSLKVTNTKHPSVWSLFPLAAGAGALPAVVRNEDNDTWMLGFQTTLASGGIPLRMGLVVVGHAPEI